MGSGFRSVHRIREAVASADIVVLTNHWMLLNLAAASAARRLGKPTVVIPSGALPITGRSRLLKRLYNAAGGTRLIFEAAAHIATTREEAGNLTAYGVRADRIHVIPNAIELPAVTPTGPSPYPTPFILFVGRLTATKGPDLLLEAFIRVASRIPHHCVLAGPDEGLLPALRRTALRAGLAARVHIPGAISREKAEACASVMLLAKLQFLRRHRTPALISQTSFRGVHFGGVHRRAAVSTSSRSPILFFTGFAAAIYSHDR